MVRVTFNPPTDEGSSPLLSYTATVSDNSGPIASFTNAVPAGGVKPMAEFVFGHLDLNIPVTVSVVAINASGNSSPVVSSSVTPVQMPGQISNVITQIMGEMAWQYANLIQAPCPRMRFGKKYLAELKDAPYVVFIPGRAELEGPSELGSGAPGSPRQLWTKRQRIEARCWGAQLPTSDPTQDYIASYGVAEQIMNNVAAAIHETTYGSELAYIDEFNPAQDNETRGVGLSLTFSVFLPVTEVPGPASAIATLTDFDQTNYI
jgi:hypothetical protein